MPVCAFPKLSVACTCTTYVSSGGNTNPYFQLVVPAARRNVSLLAPNEEPFQYLLVELRRTETRTEATPDGSAAEPQIPVGEQPALYEAAL